MNLNDIEFYSRSKVDGLLAGKSPSVHGHKEGDVAGLSDKLSAIDGELAVIKASARINATVVGEPVVSGGSVSGFSPSDYVVFPSVVDIDTEPVEFDVSVQLGDNVTVQENILDSLCGLALAVQDGQFVLAASTDGTSFGYVGHGGTAAANTPYRLRIGFVSTASGGHTVTLCESDGSGGYGEPFVTLDLPSHIAAKPLYFGGANPVSGVNHVFGGAINLGSCSLTVAGKEVWNGWYTAVPKHQHKKTDISGLDEALSGKLDKAEAANIVPKRVSNDTDTVRCDGEGNIYNASFVKGGYYVLTTDGLSQEVRFEYIGKNTTYGTYHYRSVSPGASSYEEVTYNYNSGAYIYKNIGPGPTSTSGLDPTAGDVLESFDLGIRHFTFHRQESSYLPEPDDRFVSAKNALDNLVDAGRTVKCDASGNIYEASVTTGGYYDAYRPDTNTHIRLNYSGPKSWAGSYGYASEDGNTTLIYFSAEGNITFNGNGTGKWGVVGANPENGDVLPDATYGYFVLRFHPQASEFPTTPTDRFVRESEIPVPSAIENESSKIDADGNVYGSDTILAYYYCGDDIYAYDAANSGGGDYAFTGPDGQIKYGSGGAVFFNLSVVANTTANLDPLDGDTVLPDFTRNSKTYKFKATSYSISPTPTDRLALESQLAEYALKTDIPTRVKNDADTVRIDGEGNVYDVQNAYDGGSWAAIGTLSGIGNINLIFTDCKKVGNNYQWTNPDDPSMTLQIEPNGVLRWNYAHGGSRGISTNVTSFDVFGGYQFPSQRDSTVTLTHSNTNRVPMESETPTDRLARESQLPSKTSDLENDSGFVTKVDKLDNGVKKVDIDGNIYEATVQNVGGYYRYVKAGYTPGTLPYNPTYKSDDHFHFGGNLEDGFMRYFPSTGEIRMGWGSVYVTTAEKGLNPLAGDVLPDFEYEGWSYTFTAQTADFPEEPADQFAKVSEIPDTSGFMKKTDVADNANSAKYLSGSEHRVDAEGKMYPAMGNYWVAYTTSGDRTWGKYQGKSGNRYTWGCNSAGWQDLTYDADTGLVSWAGVYGGSGYADKNLDPEKDTIVIREYANSGRTATHYGVGYSETADAQLLRGTVDGKFTDAQKEEIRAVIEEMYDNGETEAF